MPEVSIADLLHEAAETHHRVYRIVDGEDADWASWYADWLIDLSELPELLGRKPVRSELVYLLVLLDKEHTGRRLAEPWERYYASRIAEHFRVLTVTGVTVDAAWRLSGAPSGRLDGEEGEEPVSRSGSALPTLAGRQGRWWRAGQVQRRVRTVSR